MRKLALVLCLLPFAASCTSFAYENETYWESVRRRSDGRSNAFGRDLRSITAFLDRHLWNYNENDPYINYPTSTTKLEHIGRFGIDTVTALPLVDEITTR